MTLYPVTLAAPGDDLIWTSDVMEQVSSVTGYTDSVDGETATRTVTREFATSTDGTTFTAYQTLNTANLAALVLDPNDPFYIRIRYTRGGADLTGLISFYYFRFETALDPSASVGAGKIANLTLTSDIKTIVNETIANTLINTLNGYDRWEIQQATRRRARRTNKGIIYHYLTSVQDAGKMGQYLTYEIEVRIGFIHADDYDGYESQFDRIREAFAGYNTNLYTFDLKGVTRNNVRLADMGIRSRFNGMTMLPDLDEDTITHEASFFMTVQFQAINANIL